MTAWLDNLIEAMCRNVFAGTFLAQEFTLRALLAIILVSLICGAVGSLVVGNRMAFFSDALAHCAFAGVAIGLLTALIFPAPKGAPFYTWGMSAMMVGFGIAVGLAIAFVKERSSL